MIRCIAVLTAVMLLAQAAGASERLRVASWNAELFRKGPGLLLRDIRRGEDDQVTAAARLIAEVRPDVLALQGFDFDYEGIALQAFAATLAEAGWAMPHLFALPTNRGLATGLDMDGDGRAGDGADAQGFGRFYGQGAMALLSRLPVDRGAARDFTALKWRDLPGALLPRRPDGTPFPSARVQEVQRLSSSGHWDVPVKLDAGGRLHLLMFHAAPPVFDGPEDRNGRRNHDEIRFWQLYLDGALGPVPARPFVILGSATLDPDRSDGRRSAIRALLADPRIQDAVPRDVGGAAETVNWPSPGPGRLRVDYVLPSADLNVRDAGLARSTAVPPPSRHALVWVDVTVPSN